MPAQSSPAFMAEGRERQTQISTVYLPCAATSPVQDIMVLPADSRRKHLLRAWIQNDIDPAATDVSITLNEVTGSTDVAVTTLLELEAAAALAITQIEVINPIIPAGHHLQAVLVNTGGSPDAVQLWLHLEYVVMDR